MSESAYNEISPLIKEHCKLPSYWHDLSVDLQYFLRSFITGKDLEGEKRVKDILTERLQYLIEAFKDQLEETEEDKVRTAAEDFADNLEILLDEWANDNQ